MMSQKNFFLKFVGLYGILFHMVSLCYTQENYLGCYSDNEKLRDLPYMVEDTIHTVQECINFCLEKYYRYAGVQKASYCFCGQTYGNYSLSDDCNMPCVKDPTSTCGGENSNEIYDTGQLVPGPPKSINITHVGEKKLSIEWLPPNVTNGHVKQYEVSAVPLRSYSTMSLTPFSTYLDKSVTSLEIPDLHPGTDYNVTVAATNEYGIGLKNSTTVTTEIGEPDKPDMPVVVKHEDGEMEIKINPPVNNYGPITAYQIIVIYENVILQPDSLKSYYEAQKEDLGFYIAAELEPYKLKKNNFTFVVGDNRNYGGYSNVKLPGQMDIHISLGVVSKLGNTTKMSYSETSHAQHGVTILNVDNDSYEKNSGSTGLIIGLSVAVAVFGVLLVLSIAIYFLIKRRFRYRRRLHDNRELSLRGPVLEVDSSSYCYNGFVSEEEDEENQGFDYYTDLKHKIWSIPRNALSDMDVRLGQSQYGTVMSGRVEQKGHSKTVAVHVIQDEELLTDLKKSMLKDLDILIRIGYHENIACLVGICEIPKTLFVVFEDSSTTLKNVLLKSRYKDDMLQRENRICSLSEEQVLLFAVGIADAMDYLSSKKIVHRHLLTRNVLMTEDSIPKITNIGLSSYENNEIICYERWTAQEVLLGRAAVTKSDVWSFGVLLWEMLALGGTPYADIGNNDLQNKIVRCYRLPQLNYVGDDLYQLLVQCWQLDLDERPSFQEIVYALRSMLDMFSAHLSFDAYSGFHYEPYNCELELKIKKKL